MGKVNRGEVHGEGQGHGRRRAKSGREGKANEKQENYLIFMHFT